MEVIFVRHGETQHNKQHRLMGQRLNDPLDMDGLHQASELIAKLPKNATLILSSPLKRALQTAEIISRHLNVPVEVVDLLKERDFGTLSGKNWDEIYEETGKDMHKLDEALEYDYNEYGGESVGQVKARLRKFLELVKTKYAKERLIVVTHYGMIMLMDKLYTQMKHKALGNVSIHRYKI